MASVKKVLPSLFIVVCMAIFTLSFLLAKDYLKSKKPAELSNCHQIDKMLYADIKDGKINPPLINGGLCDLLKITNKDDKTRAIAFGQHNQHKAYNGIVQRPLAKDQSLTIVLKERGEFIFHDHIEENVKAEFIVN